MSGVQTLFAGPSADVATGEALSRAAELGSPSPDSVLCLTASRDRIETLRRRWRSDHDQVRFRCETLDGFVADCFERATGQLATETFSRVDHSRLVEAALETHGTRADNGPFTGLEQPANALVDQLRGLFSLLEYAGYDSPDAIAHALRTAGTDGNDKLASDSLYGSFQSKLPTRAQSPLEEQARVISDVYDAYTTVRTDLHPEWRGTVAEQYLYLLRNDELVTAVPEPVDVVVLHGLTRLAPAEREAVARLSEAFPALGVVAATHQSLDGTGVDAGADPVFSLYDTLGFERSYRTAPDTNDRRLDVVRAMYTSHSPPDSQPTLDRLGLSTVDVGTEREEVRLVARQVRELLVDGVDPAEIGVVVTDRASYRGILSEVLPAYDIPFAFYNELGIEETLVGDVTETLLDLADRPTVSLVRDLCTNALVSLEQTALDATAVRLAAAETTPESVDELCATLETMDEADVAAAVRALLDRLPSEDCSIDAFASDIAGTLEFLSVHKTVEAYSATGSHRPDYERSALRAVERILASFDTVAPHLSAVDPAARVRQALSAELVGGPRRHPGYVDVRPLSEAGTRSYEHLFVVGLTMGYFPEESSRMRFFAEINEADEEFGQAHTGRRARYIFGTLLAGSNHVTLTRPRHTVDGTEHVRAPVLSELERYVVSEEAGRAEPPDITAEDLQRTYGEWAVGESFDASDRPTAPLATAEWLPESGQRFASQGARCAWRRSHPVLTPHDAQIGAVIEDVFPAWKREPYSPSAVEDYARCPFLFMMKRVLGFEEDYSSDTGVSRADRGTYVHAVLAGFYRRLREQPDSPVGIDAHDRETAEAVLLEAALDRLDELGGEDTPFSKRERGRLLAGLGTPAENPYHNYGGPGSAGLFTQFLETEYEDQSGVSTQPTYLEAAVGLDFAGVELLTEDAATVETPMGPVDLHGVADRVDVSEGSPQQFHVRDYKTGRTPSRRDVLRGTKLQLPLYSLALEQALESKTGDTYEAVGGSYYTLGGPADIDPTSGLVAAREDSETSVIPSVATPWTLPFEERAQLRQFVRSVTPDRLGRIAAAVEAGAFEPTVLAESHAGCEHCSFRAVCDVRHHHRQSIIENLDGAHYVSERATDDELDLNEYRPEGGR